jgi:hypothetical protein
LETLSINKKITGRLSVYTKAQASSDFFLLKAKPKDAFLVHIFVFIFKRTKEI